MEPIMSSFKEKGKKNNKKGDGEASQLRNRSPNWSVEQTTLMLNLVREERVSLRVQGPGTFTKQFWNRLAPIINSQSEPFRNAYELQTRWKTLKAEFYDYKNCADKSGWGWDPERRVPVAPDESCWDDLRKMNAKLYKCKSKPFLWYDIMNELCGSNIATGHFAISDTFGTTPIEDLTSRSGRSDHSGTGMHHSIGPNSPDYSVAGNAEHELNELDIHAFRTTLEVNSNYSIGNSDGGMSMGQSPVVSGAASGSNSGKRVWDDLTGAGCSESSQVKKSKGLSKNKQFNTGIDKLVEESKERRDQLDNVTNKSKRIADKLLYIKRETNMAVQDLIRLQEMLRDEVSKEVFMAMEGVELMEWVNAAIAYRRQGN